MDADAKRPGVGTIRTPVDNEGREGQKFSKSCGRLLWMTAKIKILFYKNKTCYIVLRN